MDGRHVERVHVDGKYIASLAFAVKLVSTEPIFILLFNWSR
jgi:hypothetical protein